MVEYHKYRLKEIPRAYFENMISNDISDDLLGHLLLELDVCFIPLFHGTDRHILQMTSQERVEAKNYCMSAVKFLMKKYDENNWNDYSKKNGIYLHHEKYHNVVDARIGAFGWISGNKNFEYDSIYVTASPDKAFSYAGRSFVYGELGYFAYFLNYGAEEFGFDLSGADDYQRQALSYIRGRTIEDSDPVVLMILGIDKDRIRTEIGKQVNWEHAVQRLIRNENDGSYRITGDFDLIMQSREIKLPDDLIILEVA